jgi:hypothetical protein
MSKKEEERKNPFREAKDLELEKKVNWDDDWIQERTWTEFRENGFLWWVNRGLHLFGWTLVVEVSTEGDNKGEVIYVYPARCKYRGFTPDLEANGYQKLSQYLKDNAEEITKEAYLVSEEDPESDNPEESEERESE